MSSPAARLDGLKPLEEYLEAIRGKVHIDRSELLNPRVEAGADIRGSPRGGPVPEPSLYR